MSSIIPYNIAEKVLFVGLSFKKPNGGIGAVLHSYSLIFDPFKIVCTSSGNFKSFSKIWYMLIGFSELVVRLFFDRKIEVVHVHSASGNSFWRKSITMKMAKLFRKKVIFHCHGGGFREFRKKNSSKVDSIINKYSDAIITLSPVWKEYFESIYNKPVFVVNNIIDIPQPQSVQKDKFVHFLFLGKICKAKGIYDLVNTIADHKEELEGKMILHIGGNAEIDQLSKLIDDRDVKNLIRYEGWVDMEKKSYLLSLCDVFILPSYIEGVPITLLEAESYSKPVISSNVGGIPSIVTERWNGLFIIPGDYDSIYSAITEYINNPNERLLHGQNGYQVSQNYFPTAIIDQLTNIYQRLIY